MRRYWTRLEENLYQLYHEILNKTYAHQPYKQFIIHDTKPRLISIASVHDRVVHHYVSTHLKKVYARYFYAHSYAAQDGKGTTAARTYVFDVMKTFQKQGADVWIGKMDIRRYFQSVDHAILRSILFRRVEDARIKWLCDTIIRSFGVDGRGLPLGNLTSQWFGNIYLDEFDRYVKSSLGIRWYMRYNDDLIVMGDCKEKIKRWISSMCTYTGDRLRLNIPPDKISITRLPTPVDILGIVTDGSEQWIRKATLLRAEKRLRKRIRERHPRLLDSQCSYASMGIAITADEDAA